MIANSHGWRRILLIFDSTKKVTSRIILIGISINETSLLYSKGSQKLILFVLQSAITGLQSSTRLKPYIITINPIKENIEKSKPEKVARLIAEMILEREKIRIKRWRGREEERKGGKQKKKKVFFFNDTATTEIYTLSLHDALPIWGRAVLSQFLWASSRTKHPSKVSRRNCRETA